MGGTFFGKKFNRNDFWVSNSDFSIKKRCKRILGQIGGRLAAGRGLLQGLASTPRRFVVACRSRTDYAGCKARTARRRGCFSRMKVCKRIFESRLWSPSAGRSFIKGIHLYACPAGAYFCVCKSRQNTLGAAPQDPLTAKLRLDTDWTFGLMPQKPIRTAPQIRS